MRVLRPRNSLWVSVSVASDLDFVESGKGGVIRLAERLLGHGKEALVKPHVIRTYKVGDYDYTLDHQIGEATAWHQAQRAGGRQASAEDSVASAAEVEIEGVRFPGDEELAKDDCT